MAIHEPRACNAASDVTDSLLSLRHNHLLLPQRCFHRVWIIEDLIDFFERSALGLWNGRSAPVFSWDWGDPVGLLTHEEEVDEYDAHEVNDEIQKVELLSWLLA